ncbi:MAG: ATP-dependent sacrificial sulfur transferase LarE, partial [Myxococcota bacterium]
ADSAIYPTEETRKAGEIAKSIGIRHRVVQTRELDRPQFAENGPLRCYHCKQELFAKLFDIAEAEGLRCVIDGRHEDDRTDFRPGAKAARELGIESPLADLQFTKEEIRTLSRALGLPNWDKPAHPCLSTRFAYGMKITEDRLDRVDDAEAFLRSLGVGELRIRQHGEIARVEVRPEDFHLFIDPNTGPRIVDALKTRGGYRYVTLDLEGFRSGSMNEVLVQGGWTHERRVKEST